MIGLLWSFPSLFGFVMALLGVGVVLLYSIGAYVFQEGGGWYAEGARLIFPIVGVAMSAVAIGLNIMPFVFFVQSLASDRRMALNWRATAWYLLFSSAISLIISVVVGGEVSMSWGGLLGVAALTGAARAPMRAYLERITITVFRPFSTEATVTAGDWLLRAIAAFGRVRFISTDELDTRLLTRSGDVAFEDVDFVSTSPGADVGWRQRAQDLIDDANLVVLDLSAWSPGLVWEVARVQETIGFTQCLVLHAQNHPEVWERYLREFPALRAAMNAGECMVLELPTRRLAARIALAKALYRITSGTRVVA